MTEAPEHARWSPLVGRALEMETPDGAVLRLVLDDCTVTDAPSGSFTLGFRSGPEGPGQGTYLVRGDGIPDAAVFLVPFRQDSEGIGYHAVFNLQTLPSTMKDGGR